MMIDYYLVLDRRIHALLCFRFSCIRIAYTSYDVVFKLWCSIQAMAMVQINGRSVQ